MRWTWALLWLAGGRAATRVVVEDFVGTTTGLWTDTGQRAARFRAPAVDDAELPAPAAAEPELALDAGRGLPAHALAVGGQ